MKLLIYLINYSLLLVYLIFVFLGLFNALNKNPFGHLVIIIAIAIGVVVGPIILLINLFLRKKFGEIINFKIINGVYVGFVVVSAIALIVYLLLFLSQYF